jgi:hypothetical protein
VYIIIAHANNSSSKTDDLFIKDDLLITAREERKLLDKSRWRRRNDSKNRSALDVIYDNILGSENSLNETLPLFKDLLASYFKLSGAACSFLVPFSVSLPRFHHGSTTASEDQLLSDCLTACKYSFLNDINQRYCRFLC